MGFIEDYVALASERVPEAPKEYHEAIALYMLSVVAGPNVRLKMSYGDVYPNIWVLLLGDPGITHKSTCMTVGVDLLHNVCPEIDLTGEFNPEGLIVELAARTGGNSSCRGLLFRDEFGGLMVSMRKEYMAGLKDILMHTYDVPRVYSRRLAKNIYVLRHPYLPFLTATTPSRCQQVLTESDAEDGFLSRFIIMNADGYKTDFIPIGHQTFEMMSKEARLEAILKKLYNDFRLFKTNYRLGNDTTEYYNEWLKELRDKKKLGDTNPTNLDTRMPTFALKLSMLYDLSERPYFITQDQEIETYEMEKAISFIREKYAPSVEFVYSAVIGDKMIEKVYNCILRVGDRGINRTSILKNTHLTSQKLHIAIETLVESERVECLIKEGKRLYRVKKKKGKRGGERADV